MVLPNVNFVFTIVSLPELALADKSHASFTENLVPPHVVSLFNQRFQVFDKLVFLHGSELFPFVRVQAALRDSMIVDVLCRLFVGLFIRPLPFHLVKTWTSLSTVSLPVSAEAGRLVVPIVPIAMVVDKVRLRSVRILYLEPAFIAMSPMPTARLFAYEGEPWLYSIQLSPNIRAFRYLSSNPPESPALPL